MYCPRCGSEIEEEHNYCSHCGSSLSEWEASSDQQEPPPEKGRRKKALWFYIVSVAAFLLMLLGGYSTFTGEDELAAIAKAELAAIRSNQITKAYYEYSSLQFRRENSLEKFKQFIDKYVALSEFTSMEVVKSQREKHYGVVFASLKMPHGALSSVKFEFTKEEREWRILSIEVKEGPFDSPSDEEGSKAIYEEIKRYLEELKRGSFALVYEEMSSREFKEAVDLESFKEFVERHKALAGDNMKNMSIIEKGADRAKVRVLLYANDTPQPVDYYLVREEGRWKVYSLYLLQLSDQRESKAAKERKEKLASALLQFIGDLKNGSIDQAYEDTTKKFRETTSLEEFRHFLEKYPLLTEGEGTIVESALSGDVGQARVEIKSGKERALVDFLLSLEGENWKILGIHFVEEAAPIAPPKEILTEKRREKPENFDNTFLTRVIREQIEDIKKRDLYSAYKDYTSTQFRSSTPFDSFARFIDENSIFSTNSEVLFEKTSFDNNVAHVTVSLQGDSMASEEVEYELVKEGEEWKILSIKLLNKNKA